jgi:CxxC-x17-CxxC domain-containing protein
MNAPTPDRDKFRVVKSADRLKSGVIAIEKGNGEVIYRCPCDRCDDTAEVPFPPKASREFLCKVCMHLAKRGKPGARHIFRKGSSMFETPCDLCGDEERTEFMPKRDREFKCKLCIEAEREERAGSEGGFDSPRGRDRLNTRTSHAERTSSKAQSADHTEAQLERTPEAPRRRGPVRRRKVKTLGHGSDRAFLVRCDGCPTEVQVKFVPSEEEAFYCKSCYGNEEIAAGMRGDMRSKPRKYDVRTVHNAECAECGKVEIVNFRPNPNNPYICDDCFQNRRMRS